MLPFVVNKDVYYIKMSMLE